MSSTFQRILLILIFLLTLNVVAAAIIFWSRFEKLNLASQSQTALLQKDVNDIKATLVTNEIGKLNDRLTTIEKHISTATEHRDDLEKQIHSLQFQTQFLSRKTVSTLILMNVLSNKVQQQVAFEDALIVIQKLYANNATLSRQIEFLQPVASTGLPNLTSLGLIFNQRYQQAVLADRFPPNEKLSFLGGLSKQAQEWVFVELTNVNPKKHPTQAALQEIRMGFETHQVQAIKEGFETLRNLDAPSFAILKDINTQLEYLWTVEDIESFLFKSAFSDTATVQMLLPREHSLKIIPFESGF